MDNGMDSVLQSFWNAIDSSGRNYNREKIEAAYEYANELHKGQKRQSGEPYISHPVAVAEIVAGLGLDTDSVCAALLHDTVEDCAEKTSLAVIAEKFGQSVAMLVDGLTKIKQINVEDKEEANIENIRKMLLAMSKDIRVIFIKLCDRLHNMRTLYAKPENKRRITAHPDTQGLCAALHARDLRGVARRMFNVFEEALPRSGAEIGSIRGALLDGGALGAVMTGTGSAVFGVFDDRAAAAAAYESLSQSYRECFLVRAADALTL